MEDSTPTSYIYQHNEERWLYRHIYWVDCSLSEGMSSSMGMAARVSSSTVSLIRLFSVRNLAHNGHERSSGEMALCEGGFLAGTIKAFMRAAIFQ